MIQIPILFLPTPLRLRRDRTPGKAPAATEPLVENPVDPAAPIDPNRRRSVQQNLDDAPPGTLIDVEA